MRQHRIETVLLLAVIALAIALPASSQTIGRVQVDVVDDQGEPVEGVRITVTTEANSRFNEVRETNKRGRANISFADATKFYTFLIEHEGYGPVRRTLKPTVGQATNIEVVLNPPDAQPAVTEQTSFTPAEEAFNSGVESMRVDDLEAARASFEQALDLDDSLFVAHSALARVELRSGNHDAALAHAETYREQNPDDVVIVRVLYEAHKALGNEKQANDALESLSSGNPKEVAAMLYNEGVSALRTGDDASAAARFNEAVELDPSLYAVQKALAVLHARRGEWAAAVAAANAFLAEEPDDAPVLRILWQGSRQLGDSEGEKAAFDRLAQTDPAALAEEFYEKGLDLFNSGEAEAAVVELEAAVQFDPEHARAHYQLGLCHLNAGRAEPAKTHLQRFIELAPDDPEAASAREMLSFL